MGNIITFKTSKNNNFINSIIQYKQTPLTLTRLCFPKMSRIFNEQYYKESFLSTNLAIVNKVILQPYVDNTNGEIYNKVYVDIIRWIDKKKGKKLTSKYGIAINNDFDTFTNENETLDYYDNTIKPIVRIKFNKMDFVLNKNFYRDVFKAKNLAKVGLIIIVPYVDKNDNQLYNTVYIDILEWYNENVGAKLTFKYKCEN